MEYQPLSSLSREQYLQFFQQQWRNPTIAIRGKVINLLNCQGMVACHHQTILGMVTWAIIHNRFEILSLDSLHPNQGIGSHLLASAEVSPLPVIIPSNNLNALAFYQKRGYQLTQVFPDAVAKARDIKPSIPFISDNGLPIRDELELTHYFY